ncbi:MAG TPA: hypothetical protein VHS96_12730, partial [Bacteroidia bacterium]|nr:hypothetical protein [Bacteroidia bacterium]
MQKTIREELPAHLIVDFYWVDQDQYAAFTLAHREWRDKLYFASSRPSEETEAALNDAIDALSEEMNELRNLFGATCVVLAPKKQSQYQDDEDLAVVYDPDGQIVRAWLHTPRKPWYHQYSISESKIHLAAGIHLNGRTGKIQVGQKDSVEAIDNLNVSFYTMNQAGGVTFHSVTLAILLDKAPVLTVAAPRYDWQYRFSDVLATITDEDSRIESVTWAGGGDLPVYFRMEEATWELKINDSELWEYEVRSAPSDTLSMEVKFDVVNEDGTITRLTGNLVAYKSHPAIAIPNPEMGATQPMSYFSAGRYLIEFADDADHGIARILIRESEFELERWGLSVSYGIGTGNRARLYISNYANFLPEFERRKTIVGNTAKARFRCLAEDVHGQPTSLAFDFVFNVDSGATWHPEMVSGQLGQYSSSRILGALKDSNGGILTRPIVDGKSRAQWASATGLGFELVSGTEPYSNLEILFASRFATYSKGFTLNPAKNSASGQFVANSVDAFGGASSTTIQLTVLDTPATATRKTKFDDARAFTEIIPTTDALYSVEDSTDGGILSLRDVSGQSWLSSGKLGWRLVETIPQAEVYVNDLQTFITAFKGI